MRHSWKLNHQNLGQCAIIIISALNTNQPLFLFIKIDTNISPDTKERGVLMRFDKQTYNMDIQMLKTISLFSTNEGYA